MSDRHDSEQGGKVIEFPTARRTPPPLPHLPHANPMPGYRPPQGVFAASFTHRYDRNAA